MHFSQEISHRSFAGHLAVQARSLTSFLGWQSWPSTTASHDSGNGMEPVFPRSLVVVSGSGDAVGGKQLLPGPQGHLPKAWEGM